jgi:acyl carrier protein
LDEVEADGVDPEALWKFGETHGYDVKIGWMAHDPEFFEVELLDRTRTDQGPWEVWQPSVAATPHWRACANDPLENSSRQQLIPSLREYLKTRLPEYMIPSAWTILKQMPLAPNGKLNRFALPAPESRPEELGEYIAPRTELECTHADIWAQVLRVDKVGVQDNFFELGGHSLLAAQAVARISSSLSMELPVRLIFEFPTIGKFSAQVDELRQTRLLNKIEGGGNDIEELLGRVASMSASKVQELMRELRREERP